MTQMPVIEADQLVKRYGEETAVAGVSFSVPAGTVLGVLGPNGAGKTTTVRMMTTMISPDSGTARVAGHDVVKAPHAVRACMGLVGQSATVDELLTCRENLHMVATLYDLRGQELKRRCDELLEQFALADAADRRAGNLSGGMRRRLDLAMSLVARPPVIFLDEPTTGLDPRSRAQLWQTLRDLVADGTTMVLTTQYLEEANQLADDLIVIDHGRIVAQGTPAELKSRAGSSQLVVTLADSQDLARAAELVSKEVGLVDTAPGESTLTMSGAHLDNVVKLGTLMLQAGIEVDAIGLDAPTLDQVFLDLTDPGDAQTAPIEHDELTTEALR